MERNEIGLLIEQLCEPLDWAHFVNEDHCNDYAEFHGRVANALVHLLQAQTWRPIEEAPKDGNAFLAYGRHTHSPKDAQRGVEAGDHWWAIILWDVWRPEEDGGRTWVFAKDGKSTWSAPTHFMLLPQPPSTDEEGEE